MTLVLIGVWAFFWRVQPPKQRTNRFQVDIGLDVAPLLGCQSTPGLHCIAVGGVSHFLSDIDCIYTCRCFKLSSFRPRFLWVLTFFQFDGSKHRKHLKISLELGKTTDFFYMAKKIIPIPDAQCMAYLPTKLGSFGGKCR